MSILRKIEKAGNALPDPATLFAGGTVVLFIISVFAASQGWVSSMTGENGEAILSASAINLLSASSIRWLFENLVDIFIGFRPLGLVLVVTIGISVAEKSGMISSALRAVLLLVPVRLITPATFFVGIMASVALDAGYIVLPPLAALIFKALGKSPLAGIAAVFAGVSSGFGANLFLTGIDPVLAGLTEHGARIIDPGYSVNPACNLYIMIASTFVLTATGWFVSSFFVEPQLNSRRYEEGGGEPAAGMEDLSLKPEEIRGLLAASAALGLFVIFIILNIFLPVGFLYDAPPAVDATAQPVAAWVSAMIPLLLLFFLIPGVVFGAVVGTIKSDRDVIKMMSDYMSLLGGYIVLVFFASIFIACFEYSGLGRMLAIEGGDILRRLQLPDSALLAGFILMIALINLFLGSMSAKWAMLSVIFVPMLMTVNMSPELVQAAYRIGDSATNTITPLNPYLVIVLLFIQRYSKDAGLGTVITMMLPYVVAFLIVWTLLLIGWFWAGLPLGVGAPV